MNKKRNKNDQEEKTPLEKAGENLFNFAIDRRDIKELVAMFPEDGQVKKTAVEYELQILKMITVGWGISFFMADKSGKNTLEQEYWALIMEFSQSLSSTTELFVGKDIDYFGILKKRLDHYVACLEKHPKASEPAAVIGPEFAQFCGDVRNPHAIMTGARMFKATIASIKEYISLITGEPVSLH